MGEGHVPYGRAFFAEALEADTSAANEPERQNLRLTLAQREALGTRRQRVENLRVLQVARDVGAVQAIGRNHPVITRNDSSQLKRPVLP